mmetsp:Transcript_117800/g.293770  ORF Transcript_117800/g.293770 Transcript_117800/m.293770 type:complete len:592 (+) Transcript_117800:63-1838(+)|eukprot:CAMPEP_0115252336 /NCGR_PEP_ID=MMETSP0270-20121206/44092_1 /TAXON_ID=71861 /ORGANISM="Scrippsiella trochoidea, Strain CCMP3099" /LENGTH=591 /DNA_ID=CAMNT_0002667783 /DNA_START=53 /DNA_END=1828 /DNA_ORIENTATION=-
MKSFLSKSLKPSLGMKKTKGLVEDAQRPEQREVMTDSKSSRMESEGSMPPPDPLHLVPFQPSSYALSDDDYADWKRAFKACREAPDSADPLKALAGRPKLLNWRSPVSGQTLLHELVDRGAGESTIREAEELGCLRIATNSKGETVEALSQRKASNITPGSRASQRRPSGLMRASYDEGLRQVPRFSSDRRGGLAAQASASRALSESLPPTAGTFPIPSPQQDFPPPSALQLAAPAPAPSASSMRKAGKKLGILETTSVPKNVLNLGLNFKEEADLDGATLESSLQKVFGAKAKVQIDAVEDRDADASRSAERSAALLSASSRGAPRSRMQNVKCRVMFDDASEAREWQGRSMQSRVVQDAVASTLQLANGAEAIDFEDAASLDTVDAITLKLDSDSAHILCGACLLYNARKECEGVVCHSGRLFSDGVVRHSGDTKVDGKSVHTISVLLSKVPDVVTQLYFTICSCGPADLSGFKDPSIMLYERSKPDTNLLEYSINQAAQSVSSVMARMIRRPYWSSADRAILARALRKLRMPLLCIDLCLAMAEESSWDIQALGTEGWNTKEKICGNYGASKQLIEARLREESATKKA